MLSREVVNMISLESFQSEISEITLSSPMCCTFDFSNPEAMARVRRCQYANGFAGIFTFIILEDTCGKAFQVKTPYLHIPRIDRN